MRSSSSPSRARVGGDAAQGPLVEEVALVVERRDLGEVDAGERERAAAVERVEGGQDQLAGGGEEHGAVELLRRRVASAPPVHSAPSVGGQARGAARRAS